MLRKLLDKLRPKNEPKALDKREAFELRCSKYVNFAKTRAVSAVVVKSDPLYLEGRDSSTSFRLLCAIGAYFVGRTELELERRGVPTHKRRIVWMDVVDTIREEMEFDLASSTFARERMLAQGEMCTEVLRNKGTADPEAVAQMLSVFCNDEAGATPASASTHWETLLPGVHALLSGYERFATQLDLIAKQAQA
jgi:hypothetical protein